MKHSIILSTAEIQHSGIVKRIPIRFPNGDRPMFVNMSATGKYALYGNLRDKVVHSPYQPEQIVYVREMWTKWGCAYCEQECYGSCNPAKYSYKAIGDWDKDFKWNSAATMPEEATREWRRILEVKVIFDKAWFWEVTMERTEAIK